MPSSTATATATVAPTMGLLPKWRAKHYASFIIIFYHFLAKKTVLYPHGNSLFIIYYHLASFIISCAVTPKWHQWCQN